MLRFASKIPLCDENYDISLEDPDNRSNVKLYIYVTIYR